MGGENFEFHGNDGRYSCAIQTQTPGKHLELTTGVEEAFRFAGSETKINDRRELVIGEVNFTNSGFFPAAANRAYIQCKGDFKTAKEFIDLLDERGDIAIVSSAEAPLPGNKSLVQEISGALLSATKSLFGSRAPADLSISNVSLTGSYSKPAVESDAANETAVATPPADARAVNPSISGTGM